MGCFHRPAAGWWHHHTGGVCGRAVDCGLCWRQAGDCSKKLHLHTSTISRLAKLWGLTPAATCEFVVPATCAWTCPFVFVQCFSQNTVETIIQCCDWLASLRRRSVESRSPAIGSTNLPWPLWQCQCIQHMQFTLQLCSCETQRSVCTSFSFDSSPSLSLEASSKKLKISCFRAQVAWTEVVGKDAYIICLNICFSGPLQRHRCLT